MDVQIIQVPYDSGHRSLRMGRGPAHLVEHGAGYSLVGPGRVVHVETVEAPGPFRTEIATSFALANALARRVRHAIAQSRFPIVLAGNCGTSLGTVAGLGDEPVAVIWL
ncbi:MAG: arginase family protein, partial [Gemmatimonadaceae bacterium]